MKRNISHNALGVGIFEDIGEELDNDDPDYANDFEDHEE